MSCIINRSKVLPLNQENFYTGQTILKKLPVHEKIFSYLNHFDLVNTAKVSHAWNHQTKSFKKSRLILYKHITHVIYDNLDDRINRNVKLSLLPYLEYEKKSTKYLRRINLITLNIFEKILYTLHYVSYEEKKNIKYHLGQHLVRSEIEDLFYLSKIFKNLTSSRGQGAHLRAYSQRDLIAQLLPVYIHHKEVYDICEEHLLSDFEPLLILDIFVRHGQMPLLFKLLTHVEAHYQKQIIFLHDVYCAEPLDSFSQAYQLNLIKELKKLAILYYIDTQDKNVREKVSTLFNENVDYVLCDLAHFILHKGFSNVRECKRNLSNALQAAKLISNNFEAKELIFEKIAEAARELNDLDFVQIFLNQIKIPL